MREIFAISETENYNIQTQGLRECGTMICRPQLFICYRVICIWQGSHSHLPLSHKNKHSLMMLAFNMGLFYNVLLLFKMLCCRFRFCSLYVAVVLVPSIITLFKLLLWNSIYLPSIAIGPSQCIIGQFLNIGHYSLN